MENLLNKSEMARLLAVAITALHAYACGGADCLMRR